MSEPLTTSTVGATVIADPATQFVEAAGPMLTWARSKNDKQLNHILDGLVNRPSGSLGSPLNYMTIRAYVCAINTVMNERGLRPPRFRESRRVPYKPKPTSSTPRTPGKPSPSWLTPEQELLSSDRKMIDLHWLHVRGKREKIKDLAFRDLFDRPKFDFELASDFLAKDWKTEARATSILQLTEIEQWQLASIVSNSIQKQWKRIEEQSLKVDRILRNHAFVRPQLAADVKDFKLLWITNEIAGGAPLSLIAKVFGWQKGEPPLSTSTISAKLKRMKRWTVEK
jgi:hypothetical protein